MSKQMIRAATAAAFCAAVAGGLAYAQGSTDNMPSAASAPANTQPNDQRFNTGSNAGTSTAANTGTSTNSDWNADGTRAPRSDRH